MHRKTVVVLTIVIILLFFLKLADCNSVQSVDVNSDVKCQLTVTSPNNSETYKSVMLLNFTVDWSINASINWMTARVTRSIDNNPGRLKVDNQFISFETQNKEAITNTATGELIPLSDGRHSITLNVEGEISYLDKGIVLYNFTFNRIYFTVDNSRPNPTPTSTPTAIPTPTPTTTPTLTATPVVSPLVTPSPQSHGFEFTAETFYVIVVVVAIITVLAIALVLRKRRNKKGDCAGDISTLGMAQISSDSNRQKIRMFN